MTIGLIMVELEETIFKIKVPKRRQKVHLQFNSMRFAQNKQAQVGQ